MLVYSTIVLWNYAVEELSTKVLLVFLSVLFFVRGLQLLREAISLPPGPWGLPILGSLPFLKGDLHLHYRDLTHKYGSLFSTRLGSQLIVVLSDYKLIRDAFRKEEFTGRPTTEFTDILGNYGKRNLFSGFPLAWLHFHRTIRRFTYTVDTLIINDLHSAHTHHTS